MKRRTVMRLCVRKLTSRARVRSLLVYFAALVCLFIAYRFARLVLHNIYMLTQPTVPYYEPCSDDDPGLHPDRLLLDGARCVPSFQADGSPEIINFLTSPTLSNDAFIDCTLPGSMRMLTASDGGDFYFNLLLNLIASVQFWEPEMPITVYDMGFSLEQRAMVEQLRNVEVRVFPFDKLPRHIKDLSTYAFKPLAWLDATRHQREECFLWQDAGQEFRRPINYIRHKITREGMFLGMSSQAWPVKGRTYPGILSFFQVDLDIAHHAMELRKAQNLSTKEIWAGTFGWTRRPAIIQAVVNPFAACALLRKCIFPPGAVKANSLQDQTVLNILLYVRRWPGEPVPPVGFSGKYIRNPVEVDDTIIWRRPPSGKFDPKKPSDKFEITSRKRDKSGALPYKPLLVKGRA